MRPLREWLKPPRQLLLILFLLTLVSVSALGWFGWRLLDQERIVEAQRTQERLEHAADRLAATLRGALAETGEGLAAPAADKSPEEGLLLLVTETSLTALPPERLLYYPYASPEPEARGALFSEAESYEFQQSQPFQALELYTKLAASADSSVRAGALLRTARVLRKTGRTEECRAVYERLAAIPGVKVAGAPAELVGRVAIAELTAGAGSASLRADLLRGRWKLTRGQFRFYWNQVAAWSGHADGPPADRLALAEAAAKAWQERRREPGARGQETIWIEGQPFFLLWRGSSERRAVLIARPESILNRAQAGEDTFYAAEDSEGHLVAGRRSSLGHAAVRTAAQNQLPWTLYVTPSKAPDEAGVLARQRFLLLGIAVMVTFLIVGTYFIARAIRHEAAVARMQSDFVSAVSHEFRSPLTSMRQLSEILAFGRLPSDDRRQVYYDTLVRETTRLQRLVEALLNFGRMEAGARLYRFEELETAALVERVVSEFEPHLAGDGRHIEMHGAGNCRIEADPEAISVALRNLVDNAIKYSPDQPTVWVEWGKEAGYVAIQVRDQGHGIRASERKAIFRKFVRGSAAAIANVKGSGVGLAMVRHIVAAHHGEIRVASEPGQGSTFTMLLPAMERP
jgi:signal transduction histidine kinase